MFGAGTVQWSWGLDANHDNGGTPVDPDMQQATVNLLADMGAQPATLQSGLVAATQVDRHDAAHGDASPRPRTARPLQRGHAGHGLRHGDRHGGGVVAGVEVSTDDGATWHPRRRGQLWTYTWTPSDTRDGDAPRPRHR